MRGQREAHFGFFVLEDGLAESGEDLDAYGDTGELIEGGTERCVELGDFLLRNEKDGNVNDASRLRGKTRRMY